MHAFLVMQQFISFFFVYNYIPLFNTNLLLKLYRTNYTD